MTRPVILLDTDGIIANFLGAVFRLAQGTCGGTYRLEDVVSWNFMEVFPKEHHPAILKGISGEGFCLDIPEADGAREGVRRLSELGDVWLPTSPWKSPYWMWERQLWLERFGIDSNRVMHVKDKTLIGGDVLIEDNLDNAEAWAARHKDGVAIVWDAPYNRQRPWTWRARGWDDVCLLVTAAIGSR